jgi:isopentenyl diphosphate isomerase/L-lactate dehydrogenase-like FMN-dependent dehydrogenase
LVAKAVFIGRPYVWGSAAFGQAGVERVLDILRVELVMKQRGARSIAEIGRTSVGYSGRRL